MKVHDLGIAPINEGPWDALKNFGRAIVDPTDKSGKQEFYKYKTSMQTQFQRWANQTGAGKPDLKDVDLIAQWLCDQYGVNDNELKQMGLPPGCGNGGQQGQEQPQGQTAPADDTAQEQPQGQEAPAEQKPSGFNFKDANAFKAEWDKYVAAQNAHNKSKGMGEFKLISEPKLLAVLKSMWMQTGGTKTESAKKRGKTITESKLRKAVRKSK